MKQVSFWIILLILSSLYFQNCHSDINQKSIISVARGDTTNYTKALFDFIQKIKNKNSDEQIFYISKCESCFDRYYFFTLKNGVSQFYSFSFDCEKFEISIDSLPSISTYIFNTADSLLPFLKKEKMQTKDMSDTNGFISQSIPNTECYHELMFIKDNQYTESGRFYDADSELKSRISNTTGKQKEIDNLLLNHNRKSPWNKLLTAIRKEIHNIE